MLDWLSQIGSDVLAKPLLVIVEITVFPLVFDWVFYFLPSPQRLQSFSSQILIMLETRPLKAVKYHSSFISKHKPMQNLAKECGYFFPHKCEPLGRPRCHMGVKYRWGIRKGIT